MTRQVRSSRRSKGHAYRTGSGESEGTRDQGRNAGWFDNDQILCIVWRYKQITERDYVVRTTLVDVGSQESDLKKEDCDGYDIYNLGLLTHLHITL